MNKGILHVVGAGRMGRGIALSYALAGQAVRLVDLKERSSDDFDALQSLVRSELADDIDLLQSTGFLSDRAAVSDRVQVVTSTDVGEAFAESSLVYEAVPETLEAKKLALGWIGERASPQATVASTTSTLDVEELSGFVSGPDRFLNAHWLNPAHLMPLVEVSVGSATSDAARESLMASLTRIGKIGVVCKSSPGYIVPRIQALAMNEAARLSEEGVASVEDIDVAVRVGFGLRFAVLGLLEFIDWGGNDILYYASQHLSRTVDADRYSVPEVISNNMASGRNGVREGEGFYDYSELDVPAYRRERMGKFVSLLAHLDLLPEGLGPVPGQKK